MKMKTNKRYLLFFLLGFISLLAFAGWSNYLSYKKEKQRLYLQAKKYKYKNAGCCEMANDAYDAFHDLAQKVDQLEAHITALEIAVLPDDQIYPRSDIAPWSEEDESEEDQPFLEGDKLTLSKYENGIEYNWNKDCACWLDGSTIKEVESGEMVDQIDKYGYYFYSKGSTKYVSWDQDTLFKPIVKWNGSGWVPEDDTLSWNGYRILPKDSLVYYEGYNITTY